MFILFGLSYDDNVYNLMKTGIEYFKVSDRPYDINFLDYRFLNDAMKNFLFYNQDLKFEIYFPEQASVKLMK
jgi:hypothetical protein